MAVEFTQSGRVGLLVLNRPPANSLDLTLIRELDAALERVAEAEDVRTVVVRSALDRFFCAGADIKAFAEGTPEGNMELIRAMQGALGRLAAMPNIFIAEIAGHALGGGLEVALACDLRFAASGAFSLGLPEVTLGLMPGAGGSQRLPRLVGWSRALDLMVTGRTIGPEEGLQIGLLDRVHPAGSLEEETAAYASAVADGAYLAARSVKRAVRQGMELSLDEGLALERELMATLFASEDAQEGLTAFVEKRPPTFRGR